MREYKETVITDHLTALSSGEETVAVIGDTNITASKGSVINVLTPDNGATEFDIIDFETMQPTGRK